jgi:membrane-bound serine protease (ClpP class)
LILGALGVYAECCRPGLILPGVAGGILFLLGLSVLRNLPIDWVGAALLAAAFALFPLGAQFPKIRILGACGTAALVVGAHLLVAGSPAKPGISWTTAIGLGTPFSGVTIYLLAIAARARRNKHETGL